MSGASFSTPSSTLTSPQRKSPWQLQFAERSLYKFVLQVTENTDEVLDESTLGDCEHCHNESLSMPHEIYLSGMKLLCPLDLLAFGATCKILYVSSKIPSLWLSHNTQLLNDLNLGGTVSPAKMGSRQFFTALYGHSKPLSKVMTLLNSMNTNIPSDDSKCQEVEELFKSRLNIKSPWCPPTVHDRLEQELATISQTPCLTWQSSGNVIGLELLLSDGFYQGECLHFHIYVGDGYPHVPPVVKSLSSTLYHPQISSTGAVTLGVLQAWTSACTLKDVILGIEELFVDPGFLTNNFTL
jgi:ubiquitin-protein ligase